MELCELARFGRVHNIRHPAEGKKYQRHLWMLVDGVAVLLVISTLLGFFGESWWYFDWFSHFRVQYIIVSGALFLIYLTGKHRLMGLIIGVFFLVNFSLVLPLYYPQSEVQSNEQTYKILLANVLIKNQNHDLLSNLIVETAPDIVMLLEINQTWLDDLNLDSMGYSYSISKSRDDNFGIAFFSRYPLDRSEFLHFGSLGMPSIVATLELDNQPLNMIVSHPFPPKSKELTLLRNSHMEDLMTYAAEQRGNTIVAGDINSTSWSPFFKKWLQKTNLRDSRPGFGVQPSWPTQRWWFLVPIDHILVSPGIIVTSRVVGPEIGSDHFPVLMEFSIAK